jgi:hypothetical protein
MLASGRRDDIRWNILISSSSSSYSSCNSSEVDSSPDEVMDMDTIRMPARRSFPNITIPPLRVIAFAVVRIGGHANPPAIGALLDMHDATKNALRRRFITSSIFLFRHVALSIQCDRVVSFFLLN